MQKYRPFLIIAVVLVVAIIGAVFLWQSGRQDDPFPVAQTPTPVPATSPQPIGPRQLPANAVVTLEEFGDYQCPPCGVLHPTLKKYKQELGPNLNFIFRNLPLSTLHKNALAAAQAAEAARVQDRFWEMHDFLYENQEIWGEDINPRAIFVKFAADLGLDMKRFERDMDDKQVLLRIEADRQAAAELGINSTPTILIDGRRLLPENTNPEGIRKGIEYMMSQKLSSAP
jgi:protein-disulfide isomerase